MKQKTRILVVDDDPNLRKTLGDILKVKGYEVVAAATGAEGMAEAGCGSINPDSSLAVDAIQDQGVVGRVLTRPLRQAQDRHVGLKPDLRPNGLSGINVALIDLKLPDMSGIEVMEKIKAISPLTEAIILTGHAAMETAIEAINKGAFSYLLKPYKIDDLLQHIRHAVDRQQAQEEIRRLASFPRLNPMPVIEVAPSGEITYTNPAADKLFPDLRLLDGHHPLLIGLGDVYASFRQGSRTELTREVAIGESSYEKHIYYVPENEQIRITVEDVTARKQAEAAVLQLNEELENKVAVRTADLKHAMIEAEQANRAKSDFLVNMSHEIRTPMNGVIGMIDVLKQSGLNDRQAEMANIIHDSAFALLTVIDDILDFSRIEAGKLQIGTASMAIASVVDRVCATLDTLAEKNAVELTLTTDPAIPAQVLGDSGRLRQILLNLVNNAIKFSGGQQRQGKVSVRAMLVESNTARVTLEFRVTDNGIGMDAATQARLFDAFTQADTSTTRNFGGAGLGLAISGQLVNIMGGEIRVQSEPGIGSTFTVRLPFVLPPALSDAGTIYTAAGGAKVYGRKVAHDRKGMANNANATPAPLSREGTHQRGNLILVAEDNEINQKVILQQLKLLGQTADIASNGSEALERWRGGGYSFLFTDLHMPEMDGYELTAAIRTAEAGKTHMPIIAITANALRGEDEHCRAAGMDDYLSKPVQLVNLKAMLEKWLPAAAGSASPPPPPLQGEGWGGDGLNQNNSLESHAPIPPSTPPLKGGENVAAASVPVDVNVLKALVGDDEATIREFLHDFRVSAAKIATELKTACENRQAVQAGALAHKLKSSARSMGALALGELCAAMEQAGKSGDTKGLEVLLPRFGAEMAAVDEYLGSLPA